MKNIWNNKYFDTTGEAVKYFTDNGYTRVSWDPHTGDSIWAKDSAIKPWLPEKMQLRAISRFYPELYVIEEA